MVEVRDERRLAAILAADVVGYSRLMGTDESGTLAQIKSLRKELIDPKVTELNGNVVKTTGDGLLIEFPSVLDAVQCAIDIQRAIAQRNTKVPEDRRVQFRMGINQGDVIVEEGDIYGDGINVASRLEGLAEPGGICISRRVHEDVAGKLDLRFDDLGEQTLKNIERPVQAFSIDLTSTSERRSEATPLPLPDRPSIAVLPFNNMSGDPEQEYFSDGISEDIITALSKISDLFVIARNSSFAYRGKATDAKDICRDLGVRYMLEGSVRKAGDRIRVTAQLIDGTSGGHLWADRFDRQLKDIFDLQDEVTAEIVSALEVKLTPSQQTKLTQKDTTVAEAHDYLLRGRELQYRLGKETNLEARSMFERAAELDPSSATAVALVGQTYLVEWFLGIASSRESALDRAHAYAQDALRIDDSVSAPHRLMGQVHLYRGYHDLAIPELDRAISIEPNYADNYAAKSFALSWVGRPEEALASIEVGMRLDPQLPPGHYLFAEGLAYFGMRNWIDAIDALRRSIERNPDDFQPHAWLAASLSIVGRVEEARKSCLELLRTNPGITISKYHRTINDGIYLRESDRNYLYDGLRRAGLPEG